LALELLAAHGPVLPHAWVSGDDEIGRCSWFRQQLRQRGERFPSRSSGRGASGHAMRGPISESGSRGPPTQARGYSLTGRGGPAVILGPAGEVRGASSAARRRSREISVGRGVPSPRQTGYI